MDSKKESKRIVYYDILNIISIIAVIAMHHNAIVHGNPLIRAWNTSLIVDCICYFAVPVFCMVTGATLMNYRTKYNTKTFFKKRLSKVLIPFLFWAAIMFIWRIYVLKDLTINGPRELLNTFFNSEEQKVYYFMFAILGTYLMMPLLSQLAEEKYRMTLWYIVGVYFAINACLVPLLNVLNIKWNMDFSMHIGEYVFMAILGYLLSTEDLKKEYRVLIYLGAVVGLFYRYIVTFILSKNLGEVDKSCWGYHTWNSILLAASVFLIVKRVAEVHPISNAKIIKLLEMLSSCTFGIYLIHRIVIYYEIDWFNINSNSWLWRTIWVVPTYVISLGIVYILKKIPVLKRIVP